jgi:hypothetical protein
MANDPFFGRGRAMLATNQLEENQRAVIRRARRRDCGRFIELPPRSLRFDVWIVNPGRCGRTQRMCRLRDGTHCAGPSEVTWSRPEIMAV